MQKILVVGSSGFMGSHAVDFFKSRHEVVGLKRPEITQPHFQWEEFFKKQSFDFILNCVGSANVNDSMKNPGADFESNVGFVMRVMEGLRKSQSRAKILNISSAAVYGDPEQLPIQENFLPKPISPYGFHKYFSEKILEEYFQVFGIPTASIRVFSCYGPRLKKQILWDIYQKSKVSQEIELFGTGKETRDFIYIGDGLKAIDLIFQNAQFQADVYNVANGVQVSVREMAETFFEVLDWNGKIRFTDTVHPGNPQRWLADISKISGLGYQRGHSLKQGLQEYGDWLKREGL